MKKKEASIKTKDKSVFIVTMIHHTGEIKYPAALDRSMLGYFSSLKKAESFLKALPADSWYAKEEFSFRIFEVEEHSLDVAHGEKRTRVYDKTGNFYGEHPSDLIKGFNGREKKDCKFKPGDWVEFIDGMNRLDVGIVGDLPPDRKRAKEIYKGVRKAGFKTHALDSSDDSYFVFTGFGKYDHAHPQVFRVFKPSGKIPKRLEKHLRTRYQKQDNV